MSPNAADRIQNWMINHPASYNQTVIENFPRKILTGSEKEALVSNIEQGILVNRTRVEKHISRQEAVKRIRESEHRKVVKEIISVRGHKQVIYRDAKGRYRQPPQRERA